MEEVLRFAAKEKYCGLSVTLSGSHTSKDVRLNNQDHNMCRNVVFTDKYLYFVSKKHHRLVQIDLIAAFEKIQAGEECPSENEEGKTLAAAIVDFCVDDDGSVWALCEDSTVEKIQTDSPICKEVLTSV